MRAIFLRMGVSIIIGVLVAALISEITFQTLKRGQDRAPETILLVIPDGTAARVAAGETPPSIPDTLTFVVGDLLEVRNEDSENHQLGPLWIPPGTTASLSFEEVQDFVFACSFRPDKYLGLSVREPLTISTRILGIMSAGVPMGILLGLYSTFAIPPSPKKKTVG